jgi:hypothetical protein
MNPINRWVAGAESSKPRPGAIRGFEDSAPATQTHSRQSLGSSAFPGGAWERGSGSLPPGGGGLGWGGHALRVIAILLVCASSVHAGDPAKQPKVVPEAEQGEGVSLTVYNQNFVVVRERRLLDLKAGKSSFRFTDVAATIVPETVQFTALKQPAGTRVVEQSYAFDLVSADKLLNKYVDRDITLVTRDGGKLTGKLLSFDARQLVLQTKTGVDLVPRLRNVQDVQLASLPEGLLLQPTLLWQLDAKKGGQELVKVAYAATDMVWRVDYRARVNQASDKLDLAGWITVTNQTGTTFKDAQLKLMAGDINLVKQERGDRFQRKTVAEAWFRDDARLGQIREQAFADYHLYELGRKTTLPASSTKQIELIDIENIPIARKYVLRQHDNRVSVNLEFKNDEKLTKGLGIPLPKGPVRIFQRGADNALELVGQDAIDHTPKNELVRFRLGYAVDLAAERKTVAERRAWWGKQTEHDYEIRLRNHKKEAVAIEVLEAINGRANWTMLKQSQKHEARDVNTLVFPVTVPANAEVIVTYSIRYNH